MGATLTSDVRPYEAMKLRMLNGSHSMLAYAGFLSGRPFVRDVMADPALSLLVRRHLGAAAASLPEGAPDPAAYAEALVARFQNPAIAHATAQIAMDGSQKMPQRILRPPARLWRQVRTSRPLPSRPLHGCATLWVGTRRAKATP
ncbi:hypothetical protein QWZ10_16330 [Paracoccus cavernae]|uniref:Mannitol dehydrogenase C-terminal domain-containing protein n=1 Tax=Paracoccus cavernae TaxID=1571207 RepID=A0ABT8D9H1_9RHOB|nr:hypothetical protein [Paracoccus cavernae]